MGQARGGPWTAERDAQLAALWTQDPPIPTAEIGRRFGLTKNAVIGRARRLGLPGRANPIRRDGTPTPRLSGPVRGAREVELARLAARGGVAGDRPVQPARPDRTNASESRATPRPDHPAAHMTGWRKATPGGRCDWPLWPHGAGRDHPAYGSFCDCARVRGSYCAEHGARAYVGVAA